MPSAANTSGPRQQAEEANAAATAREIARSERRPDAAQLGEVRREPGDLRARRRGKSSRPAIERYLVGSG